MSATELDAIGATEWSGDASLIITPEEWTKDALCTQTDPDLFFPEHGTPARPAKKMCNRCTVRAECLAYALKHQEPHGVWGGMSERERRRLLKGRAK